ncbi:DUF2284 domain-containing protein [Chloroflexota bacterium]
MVRKISEKVSEQELKEDLEKYRRHAIELGASDAKIIASDGVIIDERVRAKCIYPKCEYFGTNINCPPHAMDVDMVRKVVGNFSYAIFFKVEVPSDTVAGAGVKDSKRTNPWRRRLAEIVAKIESEAFYDGHYLAVGFAGGTCKMLYCPNIDCIALTPGNSCRHALVARSSMEAVGMDAFAMAAKAGWEIYPIGETSSPSDVPHGLRLGIVLIR